MSAFLIKHLKTNAAPLGDPFRRPNSGGDPLRQDSKICLMVALVVMAYVLSIQLGGTPQGLESKVEKKKIFKKTFSTGNFIFQARAFNHQS